MTPLFVTATGTGVGKTWVTAMLAAALRSEGRRVRALKPVATGFDPTQPGTSDSAKLLEAAGRPVDAQGLDAVSPWRFAEPLSPDMAAAREGRTIDWAALLEFCRDAMRGDDADVTLIEGIGGVMVPLDAQRTVLDWIAALDMPALLVAGSYLGTLSHTLSAAAVLAARGCTLAAVVVDESPEQPVPVEESAGVLRRFVAPAPVVVVPRRDGAPEPADAAALLDVLAGR